MKIDEKVVKEQKLEITQIKIITINIGERDEFDENLWDKLDDLILREKKTYKQTTVIISLSPEIKNRKFIEYCHGKVMKYINDYNNLIFKVTLLEQATTLEL